MQNTTTTTHAKHIDHHPNFYQHQQRKRLNERYACRTSRTSQSLFGLSSWSDPAAWASGTVPQSSTGLDVQLDVSSFANVGSLSSPFQTNDIIGVSEGLVLFIGGPDLTPVNPGFLQAHDIQNLAGVELAAGSGTGCAPRLRQCRYIEFFLRWHG